MTPYYEDDLVTLHHGDCLDVLRTLPDNSVDAVVTDPPYGISFMGKQWDQPGEFGSKSRAGGGLNHRRGAQDAALEAGKYDLSAHAMGNFQRWCEAWATECLRILKPGGHLLAFGGARTWHRLAGGIEDAGFEIRDSIAWLFGSGFPKSMDVSKAIDKGNGENRARQLEFTAWMRTTGITAAQINAATDSFMGSHYLTDRKQAAIATADMFDRIRPLLPEVPECIERLVAERTGIEWTDYVKRPITGRGTKGMRVASSWDEGHATGVFRAGANGYDERDQPATAAAEQWQGWGTALKPAFEPIVVARKPLAGTVAANVLAHGTGALNINACRVGTEERTNQAGGTSSLQRASRVAQGHRPTVSTSAGTNSTVHGRWPANVVLDESQAAELDEQSGELTSGLMRAGTRPRGDRETYGKDAAGGYETSQDTPGDSGGASRFFYVAKAGADERPRVDGVAHPTVKPLELMRWLVRLVTQPGGVVLEPFAGSGTTVEACIIEGFRVVAIEREAEYLPLIEARIARRRDPVRAVQLAGEDAGLFGLLDGETA